MAGHAVDTRRASSGLRPMPEYADLVKEKADDWKTFGKTAFGIARSFDPDTPSLLSPSLLPAAGAPGEFRLGPDVQ